MAVIIRDIHLEQAIDVERRRRQDSTMAKTLSDIARERLAQLDVERRVQAPPPVADTVTAA